METIQARARGDRTLKDPSAESELPRQSERTRASAVGLLMGVGRVIAACAVALLVASCASPDSVLRMSINSHAPEYVRGQIIDAMTSAGYRKVHFRSFHTDGSMVSEIRTAGADEFHFRRGDTSGWLARVYFDKGPSEITVRLAHDGAAASGETGALEMARIRDAFKTEFIEIEVK